MNITVIGTGYVGLVTGTCFADTGNNVICVDIDENKIRRMQKGEVPIYEPHLEGIFQRNIQQERLKFTTSLNEGLSHGDVVFLALPTPENEDGSADLSYVIAVAKDIGLQLKNYKVIVDKSTVPVGTSELVRREISKNTDIPFDVVSNPEFLREGFAIDDFLKPERIIIGSSSEQAIALMKKLYAPFVRSGNPIYVMDEKSAELTKYASNAFLATKITFMNEIANYCNKVGANVDSVRKGMGSDSRIGNRFLFPGIGYGGSCFPKDVKALLNSGKEEHYDFQILDAVIRVNEHQKTILFSEMKRYLKTFENKKIALWGLAFKPETDDIREAPSLYMIEALLQEGAQIAAFDPEAMANVKQKYSDKIQYGTNLYEVVKDADALLICTEWPVFRSPDFVKLKLLMKTPMIFDGRNLYENTELKALGFDYISIGRP